MNEGKSGLEAYRVWALGVLRILQSKKKLAAGIRRETHFLSNEEKEQWIEVYVERETAVARKRGEDAQTAIKWEQDDMRNAEKVGLITTKPETTFEEVLNTNGDSLSDFASSDNGEDGQDEYDDGEDDTAGGKLRQDDDPGWVMGTISNTVQYCKESFLQKQMKLDELTQPGRGDAADNFREQDKQSGMTEIEGSGCRSTTHGRWCSVICPNDMWWAIGDSR